MSMNSIWKDLLFLHGHLVRKEDLTWRDEVCSEPKQAEAAARKIKSATIQCCMAVWPRLAAPR
jgi:hypothetical protein